jgi:hypothetical protein
MANIISILDTIHANASQEYQERVPLATLTTIEAVGNPILTYQSIQNEFLTSLVNRIALSVIQNKTAKNPLSVLKKGTIPLGSDIQEIFTNMAKDTGFDGSGSALLTKTTPDTKALYHRVNRQGQYSATITRQMLVRAFTSYAELEKMMNSIITSMYSGDNRDEFILMKNLFAGAIENDLITEVAVTHIESENATTSLIKAIKKASKAFTYPTTAFNKYYANKPDTDRGEAVTTWTPLEDQILLIRSDIMVDIDVDVLAKAFNLSKVDFLARTLEVDNFGSASNCYAILMDKSCPQIYDNLYEMTEFYNPQGLYWNYWLNHHQTYGFSLFANACAFVCETETISINPETLTLITTDPSAPIVPTVLPADATVTWLSSDETVATVSALGVVTPVANGTCKVFAINGDAIAVCAVTVNIPA